MTPPAPNASPTPARADIYREIGRLKMEMARRPGASASARAKLVRLYLQAGDPERAVSLYRYALIIEPDRAPAYHRKIGDIYRELGRGEEAEREYQLAETSERPDPSLRARGQLREWEETGRDDLLLQQYRFLFWTQSGSRIPYLRRIARILSRQGEEAEARRYYDWMVRSFRRLIEERPARALDYTLRIADLYEEMGDGTAAEREYAGAVVIEGAEGATALTRQADFYRSQGKPERALSLYREAEKKKGADPVSVWLKIAAILEDRGETGPALDWLEKAAAAGEGKEGAVIRLKVARHLARHEEPERALEAYRSALPHLSPARRAGVMEEIGDILADRGREAEAAEAYLKAMALWEEDREGKDPGLRILERLSRLAGKAGRAELSEEYSQKLIEAYRRELGADPVRAPYYHRALAALYSRRGQHREASAHYRAWSSLAPEDPYPPYRLYRLYRDHFSDPETADRYYARYRELRKKERAQAGHQQSPSPVTGR
ncbi:MAG: tetratricopeptide repeat protein [PVC group bacterium]